MLNLSPLRYARILERDGGPIERMEVGRFSSLGKSYFQAGAWLSKNLNLTTRADSNFPQADGCGTHVSAMISRHMAISEALERWALYHLYQSCNRKDFGLDIDNTSTGMAAWPGLFKRQARRFALREAVERWCLSHWACCHLRGSLIPGHQGFEIDNPLNSLRVVVVWRQFESGYFAYGFSADCRIEQAVQKAAIEMERLVLLITGFLKQHPGFSENFLDSIGNILERRIMRFSLQSGHDQFLDQLDRSTLLHKSSRSPPPLIDCHVPGPWSKYASVWRVLYPMPDDVYNEDNADLFYW